MPAIAAQPRGNAQPTTPAPKEEWLSRKEAAIFLTEQGYPISNRTLENLAYQKKGPRYRRFGWARTNYAKSTLLAWARTQTFEGGEGT